jgi:hypothetical protein
MIKYCREHEAYLRKQLDAQADPFKLLEYHNRKIGWLQHERLVHLIVTVLTAGVFMCLFGLTLVLRGNILVLVLLAGVMVLLIAYLFHYFRLENTVQHWYRLSDEIYFKAERELEMKGTGDGHKPAG